MNGPVIAIVGAGEAGVAAAGALREAGFEGRVVLLCEEPELPYQRPPLSKELLLGDIDIAPPIRPEEWYAEQGVELRLGARVLAVDAAKRELLVEDADGRQTEPYTQLLIATGGRVRELAAADIHYLRNAADGARLVGTLGSARSIVVIGGGVIGLEVASSARALGKDVTVVDLAPRLMARALAPSISGWLLEKHRAAGVEVILDAGEVTVEAAADGKRVLLGDGRVLSCDVIVAGIGIMPNVELAAMAGCRIDDGIVVDGNGRTTVEGVFAAGDVASFHHPHFERSVRIEAWRHAGRHGAHVARAMIGACDDYDEVPWFWTDQLGSNIQVAGLPVPSDFTIWRGEKAPGTAFHFCDGKLVAATTIDNGRDMRPATRLITAGWRGDPQVLADMSKPLGALVTELLSVTATVQA